MDHQHLKNIKPGMKVGVMTARRKYSTGIVDEIAARTQFHEQGIMVRLKNGDVGRVKKILLSETELQNSLALELKKLLEKGEHFHTEFKKEAFWSLTYSHQQITESKSPELREFGQKTSKIIIAKSLAAFLNSSGGNLIIGIVENKEKEKFEIFGIEEDMARLKLKGMDHYKRITIDGKTVCWINIKPSDFRIFLKMNNKEMFLIRVDSENRTLEGEKLVDYCINHWR